MARRAKGLGMNVIAHDPYAAEEKARALNVRLVTFQEAIETADFLSLHMPLTPGGFSRTPIIMVFFSNANGH